ncbi:hypothetical protein [Asaia bogorensis]|uniref:hypothetical protein n=1 Tax=Asaia bogorensis TaxID=91915 RepID=UPI0013CE98D7|nr:hypothetical protein [Asaia bogorensis]
MMSAAQNYAVYLTEATHEGPVGYVLNNILWDGVSKWAPPSGQAVITDPDCKYPIGSTFTADTTPSGAAE